MGKRKNKNKSNNNENLNNNKNPMDFINSNGNLNPLELINYLSSSNNSNSLNSTNLLSMLLNNKLNGDKGKNPLMDLISNINTDGVNMNDISKLSESLKNINNPQDILSKIISSKLSSDNNSNIKGDNLKRRRKSKDSDNLEFLKSLRSIVDPSKIEFIDKIIVMYENGEI